MFDQAEKDAKAKKRKYKVKNFLFDRLTNNQNDVHTMQAFHKKEPIKHCSRIEYQGELQRKYNSNLISTIKMLNNDFKISFQRICIVKFALLSFPTVAHQ